MLIIKCIFSTYICITKNQYNINKNKQLQILKNIFPRKKTEHEILGYFLYRNFLTGRVEQIEMAYSVSSESKIIYFKNVWCQNKKRHRFNRYLFIFIANEVVTRTPCTIMVDLLLPMIHKQSISVFMPKQWQSQTGF